MSRMYRHPSVQAVQRLHRHTLARSFSSVPDLLHALVTDIEQQQTEQTLAVATWLNHGHPEYQGYATHHIPFGQLPTADIQLAVARALGYTNWPQMISRQDTIDPAFEEAVDHLIRGDQEQLADCLATNAQLIRQSSPFGHRAGLIHYLAFQGIEIWRQQVPDNVSEMADLLLQYGARPDQPHLIGGGRLALLRLIADSHVLESAGQTSALLEVFSRIAD